ncbi:MAG: PAS domain S-box protein [Gammaproteobacteria bacterium]|nr:PAS domain S-box protein [Gammaproteobacteria bacterium]
MFDLGALFLGGVVYLSVLFLIAYGTEKDWFPKKFTSHPMLYALSLGVYATTWSFYGSVGFAQSQGFNFLTIYIGVTLAFLLSPVLLKPILKLTREYQLSSLADLFAFRYHSQTAGVLVTLFMLVGALPYIALQIRAISESAQVLTHQDTPIPLALGFCITLILFAVLFGARHISAREKHEGLVVAIAFESIIKLSAILAVGIFSLFGVFSGPLGLEAWLQQHPEAIEALYRPMREGPWTTLLLLAFAAAFLLPRQFHMTFTENMDEKALNTATWAFPLFLLLLNLFIPVILWAGLKENIPVSADYYVLGLPLAFESPALTMWVFIGGVSAASAMMIVTTLALAAMCMNHLLLPTSLHRRFITGTNIYRWLLWGRRSLIAIIILAGYGFYIILEHNQGLVQLGLISFVAVAQFLPGIIGLLYWRRATRTGFIAGLLGGALIWALALLLPLLERSDILQSGINLAQLLGAESENTWAFSTFWSLGINSLLFFVMSLLSQHSDEEAEAAQACCMNTFISPTGVVQAKSVKQFTELLARIMGEEMAKQEVQQALSDLNMSENETRSTELRQLRERIERNLSGLIGPVLAHMIVDERLQLDPTTQNALADSMRFVEDKLEASQSELQGLAMELDTLRRYHRQVLHELPMGVCSIGPKQVILSWNVAMRIISGVEGAEVIGKKLHDLPEPWAGLLTGFLRTRDRHLHKVQTVIDGHSRWFNLHKATIDAPSSLEGQEHGNVVLLEDLTDVQTLEAELTHSERLASIGRLAAGVAHEIGNPVTNIACLVQDMKYLPEGEQEQGLEQILLQTKRISGIVQSLVTFSHSGAIQEIEPQPTQLKECISEATRFIRLGHTGKQIEFIDQSHDDISVLGDKQRLIQVFVNLFSNACDVSANGDVIEISTEIKQNYIEIRLCDQGPGIAEKHLHRIFEPFFTTKQPGEGTGLGLAMVYNIIQEHNGQIQVFSKLNQGTCFVISLPVVTNEQTEIDIIQ